MDRSGCSSSCSSHFLEQPERIIDLQVTAQGGFVRCIQLQYLCVVASATRACLTSRCAAACPAEAKALAYKALNGDPISIGSELTALQALARACRAQLAALPTTADEDQLLLQQLVGIVNGTGAATEKREWGNEGQDCQQSTLTQGNNQQQGGSHHQQQQQLSECLSLAVQWRHTYKAAVSQCAECCEEVLQRASQHLSRS